MCRNMGSVSTQLHPLLVEIKKGWQRLKVTKDIKQDFLANRCGVDKGQISRWLNPDEHESPNWPRLAQLIEAMQEWPDVEAHEPIEAFARYFGCNVSDINHRSHGSLEKLAGLLALNSGKTLQILLEVTAPNSEGGRKITDSEKVALGPVAHYLRHLADDLDDRINGGVQ